MKQVSVPAHEVERVFRFLERVHHLMHQPMHYKDPEYVEAFAINNYPELKDLYYDIVWNWLPEEVRRDIEDG